MNRLVRILLLALVPACVATPRVKPIAHTPLPKATGPSACDRAATFRARVPKLVTEGKLDRTVRVIKRADDLCADTAPKTWAPLLTALAELERDDEAEKLAKTIEAAPDAPADAKKAVETFRARPAEDPRSDLARDPAALAKLTATAEELAAKGDHQAARDAVLDLWKHTRPNGRALAQAGLHERALGNAPAAQRLFDRALVELERETGHIPRAVSPTGGGTIRFSPDGKLFAVTGAIGDEALVMLGRDGATGPELTMVTGGSGALVAGGGNFDFSPNGALLVSSTGSELELLDLASGRRTGIDDAGNYVFSRDNKVIFYASVSSRALVVYDVESRRAIGSTEAPPILERPIQVGIMKESGRLYAYGDGFYLYDAALKPLIKIDSNATWTASPDEKLFASLNPDPPSIAIYDMQKGKLEKTITLPPDRAGMYGSLVFSPDRRTLALADYDSNITLFDVKSGRARTLKTPGDLERGEMLVNLAFSADNKRLCGQYPSTMQPACEFNVQTGEYLGDRPQAKRGGKTTTPFVFLEGSIANVIDVPSFEGGGLTAKDRTVVGLGWGPQAVMSPDKKVFALFEGAQDGGDLHLLLVDVAAKKVSADIPLAMGDDPADPNSILFSPDGKTLTLSSPGARILVDTAKGKVTATLPRSLDGMPAVYRPDGRAIAVTEQSGVATIIDVATGTEHPITHELTSASKLAMSADGKILVVTEKSRGVAVWDLASGTIARSIDNLESSQGVGVVSPDDKRLAIASDNKVQIVDLGGSADPVQLGDADASVLSLAFSHDGKLIAGGLRTGSVTIWDAATGELKKTLTEDAHRRPMTHLAFDAKSHWLSATNDQKMSELWDVRQLTIVRTGDRSGPTAFSPDGKTIAIGDELVDFENGTLNVRANVSAKVTSLAFTTDGADIVIGAVDGLHVINTITGVADDSRSSAVAPPPPEPDPPSDDDEDQQQQYRPPPPPPDPHHSTAANGVRQIGLRGDGRTLMGLLPSGDVAVFGVPDLKHRVTLQHRSPLRAIATSDDGVLDLVGDPKVDVTGAMVCQVGSYLLPFSVCEERLISPGMYAKAASGDDSFLDP